MSDFFNQDKHVKTRKEHRCEYCGKMIPKGTPGVLYESGSFDGYMFARYACSECQPYINDFWDYMGGESADIQFDWEDFLADCHPELKEGNDD